VTGVQTCALPISAGVTVHKTDDLSLIVELEIPGYDYVSNYYYDDVLIAESSEGDEQESDPNDFESSS
jgi:hypothetical protein